MAKTRSKKQPAQDDALFKERKPRQKRSPQQATIAQAVETPPPAPVVSYVMAPERVEAVENWLASEVGVCPYCETAIYTTDSRAIDREKRLSHLPCVPSPFEFPPLLKLFKDARELWLERAYGDFRAGYYYRALYQCGPGNVYGQFGSFGLDERKALEGLSITTIQIWTKTTAYQITMAEFQDKGEVRQTPPGPRWLVPLEFWERAERYT